MKKMGAGTESQGTAEENGPPGVTPHVIVDLARLGSRTCQLGQGEPDNKYAGGDDHPFKDNEDKTKN
jgi:hypothetical protein